MDEERRSPVAIIAWVLAGCVVFVGAGIWLTQPSSNAEESLSEEEDDRDGEEARAHDTFEDAWKHVLKAGESSSADDDVTDGSGATSKTTKSSRAKRSQGLTGVAKDDGTSDRIAQATVYKKDSVKDAGERSGSPDEKGATAEAGAPAEPDGGASAEAELTVADPSPAPESPTALEAAPTGSTATSVAKPAGAAASPSSDVPSVAPDLDDETLALSGLIESRVVTLRLSGSVGGQKLSPKDGYTWGRLAYFLQRERKPPYFLVFPEGTLSGVTGPPTELRPGEKQTVQGVPSLRPAGRLGPPLFVINLMATVESAGTMTFYGRGVAQKYVCQVNAQVVYLGGEKPEVVDTLNVSERDTIVQGRVATGPPGAGIYQKAIEKLIARLRATTYFR